MSFKNYQTRQVFWFLESLADLKKQRVVFWFSGPLQIYVNKEKSSFTSIQYPLETLHPLPGSFFKYNGTCVSLSTSWCLHLHFEDMKVPCYMCPCIIHGAFLLKKTCWSWASDLLCNCSTM